MAENLQNTTCILHSQKVKKFNTKFVVIITMYIHVCLVLGSPELDIILQVWLPQ